MSNLITTEQEYQQALYIITECDRLINKAYSFLEKIPEDNITEVIEFQTLISKLKQKRLGNFNLTKIYETKYSQEKQNKQTYIIRIGDTLPYIAYIFYGRQDLWQYIYYENNMRTDHLIAGTEIAIPKLDNPIDPFINGAELFAAEFSVLYTEKVKGDI